MHNRSTSKTEQRSPQVRLDEGIPNCWADLFKAYRHNRVVVLRFRFCGACTMAAPPDGGAAFHLFSAVLQSIWSIGTLGSAVSIGHPSADDSQSERLFHGLRIARTKPTMVLGSLTLLLNFRSSDILTSKLVSIPLSICKSGVVTSGNRKCARRIRESGIETIRNPKFGAGAQRQLGFRPASRPISRKMLYGTPSSAEVQAPPSAHHPHRAPRRPTRETPPGDEHTVNCSPFGRFFCEPWQETQ